MRKQPKNRPLNIRPINTRPNPEWSPFSYHLPYQPTYIRAHTHTHTHTRINAIYISFSAVHVKKAPSNLILRPRLRMRKLPTMGCAANTRKLVVRVLFYVGETRDRKSGSIRHIILRKTTTRTRKMCVYEYNTCDVMRNACPF